MLFRYRPLTGQAVAHNKATDNSKSLAYVALSGDGKLAVTAGADGKIRFWDTDTLKEQPVVLDTPDHKEFWMVAAGHEVCS